MSENERPDEATESAGTSDKDKPEQASPATNTSGDNKKPKKQKKKSRGGRGATILAILALVAALLALAAVAGLGYLGQKRAESLRERVATAEQAIETTTQNVILPKISDLRAQLQSLASTVEQHGGGLQQLRKDLNQTQHQLTEFMDRVMGGLRRWKLLSLEDLLLTATRQLQLEHDPQGALQALKIVNRQLAKLNDPRLLNVRKEVIEDIAALKAMPTPDIQGLVLKLTALSERVGKLPLASDVPDEYSEGGDGGEDKTQPANLPPWQHFLTSIREALEGMLTIRRSGSGTITPLMPPDQAFFLRQNLKLKLQTAKLALLRHNPQTYQASLASAREWLRRFFNTDDPAVSAAIETLGQMMKVPIAWEPPDISGSLMALRTYLDKTRERSWETTGGNDTTATQTRSGANTQTSGGTK